MLIADYNGEGELNKPETLMERDEMFQMVEKLLTAMQCVDLWRPETAYNIIGSEMAL